MRSYYDWSRLLVYSCLTTFQSSRTNAVQATWWSARNDYFLTVCDAILCLPQQQTVYHSESKVANELIVHLTGYTDRAPYRHGSLSSSLVTMTAVDWTQPCHFWQTSVALLAGFWMKWKFENKSYTRFGRLRLLRSEQLSILMPATTFLVTYSSLSDMSRSCFGPMRERAKWIGCIVCRIVGVVVMWERRLRVEMPAII